MLRARDGQYAKQLVLQLHETSVKPVDDTAVYKNAFSVRTPRKSFLLIANTAKEKGAWVEHLTRVCGGSESSLRRGCCSFTARALIHSLCDDVVAAGGVAHTSVGRACVGSRCADIGVHAMQQNEVLGTAT